MFPRRPKSPTHSQTFRKELFEIYFLVFHQLIGLTLVFSQCWWLYVYHMGHRNFTIPESTAMNPDFMVYQSYFWQRPCFYHRKLNVQHKVQDNQDALSLSRLGQYPSPISFSICQSTLARSYPPLPQNNLQNELRLSLEKTGHCCPQASPLSAARRG